MVFLIILSIYFCNNICFNICFYFPKWVFKTNFTFCSLLNAICLAFMEFLIIKFKTHYYFLVILSALSKWPLKPQFLPLPQADCPAHSPLREFLPAEFWWQRWSGIWSLLWRALLAVWVPAGWTAAASISEILGWGCMGCRLRSSLKIH